MRTRHAASWLGLTLIVSATLPANAFAGEAAPPITLFTNQRYLEQLPSRVPNLHAPLEVFEAVLSQIPQPARVYPTENYYYFEFFADGQHVRGNLRFQPERARQGELAFAYYNVIRHRATDVAINQFRWLGASDGVSLTPLGPFKYRVSYRSIQRDFELNQLEQKLDARIRLRDGETMVFRTFDESGIQFFLIHAARPQGFRFILDEAGTFPGANDRFTLTSRVFLDRRTRFVFYRDRETSSHVLIGVLEEHVRANSYFDGPFDQLADQYIVDDSFQKLIESTYPGVRGKIDRFGRFLDTSGRPNAEDTRFAIAPDHVLTCQKREESAEVIHCLTNPAPGPG